jgi:integrase
MGSVEPPFQGSAEPLTASQSSWMRTLLHPQLLELEQLPVLLPTLQKLLTLNSLDQDHRLLGAMIGFVSQSEIIQILSAWAPNSQTASELENFGRTIWSKSGLGRSLRPFLSDQRVKAKLRGHMSDHYLAALCASRRPITDPVSAHFIQKLRTLLLVQSLDLLKLGIVQEVELGVACKHTRNGCETSDDWQLKLLESITNNESDLIGYRDSLRGATDALQPVDDKSREFLRSLSTLANCGPWNAKLTIDELKNKGQVLPDTFPDIDLKDRDLPTLLFETPGDEEIIFCTKENGEGIDFLPFNAPDDVSPIEITQLGQGLILSNQEDVQFLRHSWNNLNVAEQAAFTERTVLLLETGDDRDVFGCVLVLAGLLTNRSLVAVQALAINDSSHSDWGIDRANGFFVRTPPRFSRGWSIADKRQVFDEWLHPIANRWVVALHPKAIAALKKQIRKFIDCQTLGDLWKKASPSLTFESWFNDTFKAHQGLSRVTSTAISHLLRLHSFEHSKDQKLARVISSQPRTGLPAACAYGAYRTPNVIASVNVFSGLFTFGVPSNRDDRNECGAELDIYPERVRTELTDLLARLNASSDWITRHNLLTSYVVLALYASTGSRPINSPFESIKQFDLKNGLIFIQDKVFGPTQSSRVCVLTETLIELIRDTYLPHLLALAKAVKSVASEFSTQLENLVAGADEPALPLFFFLRSEPDLDWLEVTEKQLELESGLKWPVPWNLFRHLHATQLPRMGLESEIVDALLGHGERGAETHGFYSLRIPKDDIATARHLVEQLFDLFGFERPLPSEFDLPGDVSAGRSTRFFENKKYGRSAREQARQKSLSTSEAKANSDIESAIGSRPVDSLSADDWHRIAHSMLFREDGVPYSNGSVRYRVFEEYIDNVWQSKRVLPKIRRAYSVMPSPSSLFTERVIGADQKLQEALRRLEETIEQLPLDSLSSLCCAILAALDLIHHSHVSHWKVLDAVVRNLPTICVVKLKGGYWLEWSDANEWKDGRPVFRVGLTHRCARWLTTALNSRRSLKEIPTAPQPLSALIPDSDHKDALKQYLRTLADLKHQANAWSLPGLDAGYLGGALLSSALPHADWYRVLSPGLSLKWEELRKDEDLQPIEDYLDGQIQSPSAGQVTRNSLESCAEFFGALKRAMVDGSQSNGRRIVQVKDLIKDCSYRNGDVPIVFAQFGLRLLTRDRKRGSAGELRTSTVKRYLASLLEPLCDIGHDKSFGTMDEEDLTEFYSAMLDWWTLRKQGAINNQSPTNDERMNEAERSADAARRCLVQLKELHEFAEISYGADTPDWSQIGNEFTGTVGRPGYISHQEYRLAISSVTSERRIQSLPDDALSEATTLLLCKRFGLRLGEAVGTTVDDWFEHKGAIVVMVKPNRLRPLKTESSKRQVPLVGQLDEVERSIISEAIRRAHITGLPGAPLIPIKTKTDFEHQKLRIGRNLVQLLRGVTRNPFAVLHFCRHAFACDLLALARNSKDSVRLMNGADQEQVRRLLWGSNDIDRRALWAICRMLGHRSPGVTIRSYIHGLESWCPIPPTMGEWDGNGPGRINLIDLDSLGNDQDYGALVKRKDSEKTFNRTLLLKVLQFLKLQSQGLNFHRALILAELNSDHYYWLQTNLLKANFKIQPDSVITEANQKSSASITRENTNDLAGMLSAERWDYLCDLVVQAGTYNYVLPDFNWNETLGKRNQIVLFTEQMADAFNHFCLILGFHNSDICLVFTPGVNEQFRGWFSCLDRFRIERSELAQTFQFDTAVTGPQSYVVKNRAIFIPHSDLSELRTRIELTVMWLLWCICSKFPTDIQGSKMSSV